jgi:hypothetical protein
VKREKLATYIVHWLISNKHNLGCDLDKAAMIESREIRMSFYLSLIFQCNKFKQR